MLLEPSAGRMLSLTDIRFAHLFSDLASQTRRLKMPTRGGDVEPYMGLDKIDRDARSARVHHPKREAVLCTK